jgi:hypothetical protein
MLVHIISFTEVLETAQNLLSRSLDGNVTITVHTEYDQALIDVIYSLDHRKFREALWYTRAELEEMFDKSGFFCLLVYLDGVVIAYDFGYDASEGVFFSDSTATLIEKKGIGTILVNLELVYLYEKGYHKVMFKTEETDQDGRPLREIWEKRGYSVVSSDEKGITMQLVIKPDVVEERIRKYSRPE